MTNGQGTTALGRAQSRTVHAQLPTSYARYVTHLARPEVGIADVASRSERMFEPPPQINPHLQRPPAIDSVERFLTTLFLRRYVTYCARRRRYAQMQVPGDYLSRSSGLTGKLWVSRLAWERG